MVLILFKYSFKTEGVMVDLLGTDLIHEGLLIPIEDFMNFNVASKAILTSWERRQEVFLRIKKKLPSVKNRAYSNFDMLIKAIE